MICELLDTNGWFASCWTHWRTNHWNCSRSGNSRCCHTHALRTGIGTTALRPQKSGNWKYNLL